MQQSRSTTTFLMRKLEVHRSKRAEKKVLHFDLCVWIWKRIHFRKEARLLRGTKLLFAFSIHWARHPEFQYCTWSEIEAIIRYLVCPHLHRCCKPDKQNFKPVDWQGNLRCLDSTNCNIFGNPFSLLTDAFFMEYFVALSIIGVTEILFIL